MINKFTTHKYITFILLLIFILSFSACGNSNEEKSSSSNDVEVKSSGDETKITAEDQETTISNTLKESVDLPEGYPEEIFLIYKGSFISAASSHKDGSYTIMAFSDDEREDIVEFYEEILKDAEVNMITKATDGYVNLGNYQGYSYNLTVNESDESLDYRSIYTIVLIPKVDEEMASEEATVEDETEVEDESGGLIIPGDINLPENYPEEKIPIYDDKKSEIAFVMQQGEQQVIGIMTMASVDEVTSFYKEKLENTSDYSEMQMNNITIMMGTINEQLFNISIGENDESTGQNIEYKTLIQIVY